MSEQIAEPLQYREPHTLLRIKEVLLTKQSEGEIAISGRMPIRPEFTAELDIHREINLDRTSNNAI